MNRQIGRKLGTREIWEEDGHNVGWKNEICHMGKKEFSSCCITCDESHLRHQTPLQLLWHVSFSVVLKVLLIIMCVGCVCGGRTQCLKSLYWGIIDIRRGRVQFYKFTFGRRVIDNCSSDKHVTGILTRILHKRVSLIMNSNKTSQLLLLKVMPFCHHGHIAVTPICSL